MCYKKLPKQRILKFILKENCFKIDPGKVKMLYVNMAKSVSIKYRVCIRDLDKPNLAGYGGLGLGSNQFQIMTPKDVLT